MFVSVSEMFEKFTSRSSIETLVSASSLTVPSAGFWPRGALDRQRGVGHQVALLVPAGHLGLVDHELRARAVVSRLAATRGPPLPPMPRSRLPRRRPGWTSSAASQASAWPWPASAQSPAPGRRRPASGAGRASTRRRPGRPSSGPDGVLASPSTWLSLLPLGSPAIYDAGTTRRREPVGSAGSAGIIAILTMLARRRAAGDPVGS